MIINAAGYITNGDSRGENMATSDKMSTTIENPEVIDDLAVELRDETLNLYDTVLDCPRGESSEDFDVEHYERALYHVLEIEKIMRQIKKTQCPQSENPQK